MGLLFVESASGGLAIVFAAERRDQIRAELIERARTDPAIVAAAMVGASATGGDRWSDIDLTFAVARGEKVGAVIADWSLHMVKTYGAVALFGIPAGSTIYRVFMLPGALQVDLSFGPEGEWGVRGPQFHLLFGSAETIPSEKPTNLAFLLSYAIHHVVRARVCIERGKHWQAEHWLTETREIAMTLACRKLGLDEAYARGFDRLPDEIQSRYATLRATSLDEIEQRRVLPLLAHALLAETDALDPGISDSIRPVLAEILEPVR